MADGRGRSEWQRTASIMALLANLNRDPKRSRAVKPSDFDPYAPRRIEAIDSKESLRRWYEAMKR